MGLPKVVIRGKEIILLSGYTDQAGGKANGAGVMIEAEDKLRLAIKKDPDAIAFGRVAGQWVAGA